MSKPLRKTQFVRKHVRKTCLNVLRGKISKCECGFKKGVLSILQNSSENTCVGVLSFSEVAG